MARQEIVIGDRDGDNERVPRRSSYKYKQVEQNYVREIRSISCDHSVEDLRSSRTGKRRAMKRRLRESAGMESWPLTASDRDRLISFDESRKDPSLRRPFPLLLALLLRLLLQPGLRFRVVREAGAFAFEGSR